MGVVLLGWCWRGGVVGVVLERWCCRGGVGEVVSWLEGFRSEWCAPG